MIDRNRARKRFRYIDTMVLDSSLFFNERAIPPWHHHSTHSHSIAA